MALVTGRTAPWGGVSCDDTKMLSVLAPWYGIGVPDVEAKLKARLNSANFLSSTQREANEYWL